MITLKQAVLETGLTETALRTGVNNGTLPAFRVGNSSRGKIMFDLEELKDTLKAMARSNLKNPPAVDPEEAETHEDHSPGLVRIQSFRKV